MLLIKIRLQMLMHWNHGFSLMQGIQLSFSIQKNKMSQLNNNGFGDYKQTLNDKRFCGVWENSWWIEVISKIEVEDMLHGTFASSKQGWWFQVSTARRSWMLPTLLAWILSLLSSSISPLTIQKLNSSARWGGGGLWLVVIKRDWSERRIGLFGEHIV